MEGQGMASTYTVLVVITKNHIQEKKTKHHQMSTEDAKYNWGLLVTDRGQPPGDPPVNMTLLCS